MTPAELEAALVMRTEGASYQEISDALSISRETVVRHVHGTNWQTAAADGRSLALLVRG